MFWVCAAICFCFASLQLKVVQQLLLSPFVGGIEFERTYGIFPFNFKFTNLKIKSGDFSAFIDEVAIRLKPMEIKVNTLDVVSSAKTAGFGSIDIKNYVSILSQRILKLLHINRINFNQKYVGTVSVQPAEIMYTMPSGEKIIATTNLKANKFYANIGYRGNLVKVVYLLTTNRLIAEYNKNYKVNCLVDDNKIDGVAKIPHFKQNFRIFLCLNTKTIFACNNNIFLRASYNKKVCIEKLSLFGEMITCKPFSFGINDLKVSDIEASLRNDGGSVSVRGICLDRQNLNFGTWKFANIDISKINNLGIKGLFSGSSFYKNSAEYFDLVINNASYGDFRGQAFNIKGQFDGSHLLADVTYRVFGTKNKMSVKADVNNLGFDVKTVGNIDIAQAFSKQNGVLLKGTVNYNVHLRGTPTDPVYSGVISLKNGCYANAKFGTYIKNGTIKAIIKNKKIIFEKIFATDDNKKYGTITGSGDISLRDNSNPHININFDVNNLEAVEFREFNGTLFGKVKISGNMAKKFKISGSLYSNNAGLDVSNFVTMSSYAINIVESTKPKKKKVPKKNIPLNGEIDVNFNFRPELHITGVGINSIWKGGCKIHGDLNNIKYDGLLTLERGTIEVTGKSFNLKDGKIYINDKNKETLFVDLSAVKSVDRIKVGARFIQDETGTDVTFFSKPYASKNDILSYMLFEKPSSEITAGEAFTIFSIMGKLSGNGGFDIIDNLKTVLGLDSIELKRNIDENKGTYNTVSIGRSIGKFKISVDQGTERDTTKVVVDTKLGKHTKVSVDVSGVNNVGAGIFWNKRF